MGLKRLLFVAVALVILSALIIYVFFVRRSFNYEITVPYTMQKAGFQINNLANLAKWYYPFAGENATGSPTNGNKISSADGHSLAIEQSTTFSSNIQVSHNKASKEFALFVESDPSNMNSTSVKLNYSATLFQKWTDREGLIKEAKHSLDNLKNFMEDTRQLYGYEIEFTTVVDTSFLFLSKTVPVSQRQSGTVEIFKKLIQFAREKQAAYTGTRIFYSQSIGKDSLMLFASIGIANHEVIPKDLPFKVKKMPFGKNLLVANFQGPYHELPKVYAALENFKSDHQLSSMAIPYQQFINDGYDFADSQVVQMKVYYPIF